MSQYFTNNKDSFNTVTTVNVSNSFTVTDDRSSILAWLSPLEPRLRHQDIRASRVENVGEWLLQTEEFRSWHTGGGGDESGSAVLFCYGNPGVGKTYISSLVIDRLCDQAGEQNATVACFYFDFAAQKEQSPTSMLGALLKQAVGGLEEVPGEIVKAYQDQKKVIGGRGPQLSDLVRMLQITSCKKPIFICIDALDECAAGHRVKILDSLNQILEKSPAIRIFMTGRDHIRSEIGRCLDRRVANVSISPKRGDIITYLHARLHEDTTPDAMDTRLEADILKRIPEGISEIFLLVSLNIHAILQETTIHRRRQKLNSMTDGLGLGDAYGATLGRIKAQGGERSRLGMAALMWISHAERPLKPDELCHALAVEIGSPDLNPDNIPSIRTLLACCQGLFAVDKETSTVRLIHFTLQEYLRARSELFGTADATMAETCLSYLNSRQVKTLSANRYSDLRGTPFVQYSSLYWGTHAKRDLSGCAKLLILKLFDDFNNHISTEILLKAQRPYWYAHNYHKPFLFSGLHCASAFGIVEIVAGLIGVEGCDINQADCTGGTPLVWAAWNGHERVVKMLLGRDDIKPDKSDNVGQTPLCRAARNGHEGVVKILLGRDDVNPENPDYFGQTPLCCAAWSGHEGVAKILLGRDGVNPEKRDNLGQTPLLWAARNGHAGVVKMLLGRGDVNPDNVDNVGHTPLCCAAWAGHEGVVKMLLGQGGVNPEKPDKYGQTPLWWAAWSGRERVVEILLGRADINPDRPNDYGQTPLNSAAWNGHEGVVKILLGRGDVKPDNPDNAGRAPLCCAAWKGHERVVEMLLGRDGVNPEKPDKHGQTPLWLATRSGHEGVVKMLLKRSDVNPDRLGGHG